MTYYARPGGRFYHVIGCASGHAAPGDDSYEPVTQEHAQSALRLRACQCVEAMHEYGLEALAS
jgi:hypothetical protein